MVDIFIHTFYILYPCPSLSQFLYLRHLFPPKYYFKEKKERLNTTKSEI